MITASQVEVKLGARLLFHEVSFHIGAGDRIGLVGRNGAGKTTLTRILAGEGEPTSGTVTQQGPVGYLPQDPRTPNLEQSCRDRILAARGLDDVRSQLHRAQADMATDDPRILERAMKRYARAEAEFIAQGGYAAEAEAAQVCSHLALPERLFDQPLKTLSGGQRRRAELARILFSPASTLLLDEPTNHLDADSIFWLRNFLQKHHGGLLVISHDVTLLESVVNRVFYLDADRGELDQYNMGWKKYLLQRETDERARRRERANAERKAQSLLTQAHKMGAKASKAVAAKNMARRAEQMLERVEGERAPERVAALRFPTPSPCGKLPLSGESLSKHYGSLEVFTGVDLAIDRGSRVVILGLNGAGKTTLLRILAGVDSPGTGQVHAGYGLKRGYFAQEHESLDLSVSVLENMRMAAPEHLGERELRSILGSFLFSGDDVAKPARVLSGGERTRLALATIVASGANVLLLDEPTNNLDPASREEVLAALRHYEGAVILVSHDEGAVEALNPERVLLLPDGVEDLWGPDYQELISLA